MEFKDWITQQFLKWQLQTGQRKTVLDFANYLGVAQPALRAWMEGEYKPKSGQNIALLVAALGPEVYDLLGVKRNEEATLSEAQMKLARELAGMPKEFQQAMWEVVHQAAELAQREPGVQLDQEELARLLVEKYEARLKAREEK